MVRQQPPTHHKIAWEDRFNRPSPRQLREALPAASARLFDVARERLVEIFGDGAGVQWHGLCWKWTLSFPGRSQREPLAVMIPNPGDFQIAMRVDDAFIQTVWTRRMRRAVRDGLGLAAEPFDTEWGVWTVNSQPMLDEIIRLVRENAEYRGVGSGPKRRRTSS